MPVTPLSPLRPLARRPTPAAAPSVPAGALAWYKADALAALDGDLIASWTDSSGSGNHATGTGTQRPTFKTGIQNGKPALRFNGTTNFLMAGFGLAQPAAVYLVVARVTWGPTACLHDGAAGDSLLLYGFEVGDGWGLYAGGQLPSHQLGPAPFLSAAVADGASSSLRFNAHAPTTGATGSSTPGGVTLGARAGGTASGYYADCDICEAVVYPRALSAPDDAQLTTYLNSKYAIY